MKRIRFDRLCLVAGLLAPAAVSAQRLSADEMKAYGGKYAIECGNPGTPRLSVTPEAISIERAGQRMVGRNVTASASYFGRSPPKGFEAALIGEVRGGGQMMFMVYADKAGRLRRDRGRACDPGRARSGVAETALSPLRRRRRADVERAATGPAAGAGDQRRRARHRRAARQPGVQAHLPARDRGKGRRALARAFRRPRAADAPPRTRRHAVCLVAICKAHDCYDHNAVFLYSAEQQRVLGLIQQAGVKTLVGGATPAQGAQLDLLWQAEWRQK